MKKSKFLVILSLVLILCAVVPQVVFNADAAEAQTVVSLATQQVGGDWPNGWCLAYIANIFNECYGLNGNIYSSCCAYQNGNRFIDSTSRAGIPIGACVYFGGSSVVCNCGNRAGHIAVHIGNGSIVHAWAGKIVCTSIDYVINCGYPYRGYGWYADLALTDATISYATITEGTYAIKCPAAGAYVTVQDNLDVVGQNILATFTRTGFEIKKSTTTEGYAIRALCSTNRMMNVYTEHVTSGNTVCLWDDTGHTSQRWYFEKVSGGYVIRSVQTPSCVLTVEGNGNIGVSTYSGAPGQIWILETFCTSHKYSSATCTKPKTCTICGATTGKTVDHSYAKGKCTWCGHTPVGAKIATQPKSVKVLNGKTAKVTVKATGDGLGYTWYYAKKGASKYTKASTTGNSFSVKMSSSYNGTKVYCIVKDRYGNSVKTNVVTLSMGSPAKITTPPKNTAVYAGSTAKISIKATGDGLSYTWYYAKKGASKYTKTSATGSSFSVKTSSSYNGCKVYCVVKDKYGNTVKSKVVTLTVKNKAKITTQPKSVAVTKNKTAKVTVKATGDGLKYQWYYANKGASKWTKSSVKSATYSTKMTASKNGRRVYCVIKDKYGNSVKSAVVTLSMKQTAKITTQLKSVKVAEGKNAKFTLKATGDGLKYTWYYAKKGASKYTKSSETSNVFTVKASASLNGCKVYCVVKDKYGNSVKSKVVTLTVQCKAKITAQPKSVSVENGKTAKVTVKATGDGLKYQWYYAKKGSSSYKKISGATKASYSVKMTSSVNGRKVYCKVTDKYGNSVKSSVVTLSMTNNLGKVVGSWVSVYGVEPDGTWGPNFDYQVEIGPDGSAYVLSDRVILYTGIKFVKKTSNKYYYQMMEGEEYLQHNSTPYDDGLIDVIYDLSTDTLELQFDYGYTAFFERGNRQGL